MQAALPVHSATWKPQCYFLLCTLNNITAMDKIPSNLYCKVASNGSRSGGWKVCRSNNFPTINNTPPKPRLQQGRKLCTQPIQQKYGLEDKSSKCFSANDLSTPIIFSPFKAKPFFSNLDIISPIKPRRLVPFAHSKKKMQQLSQVRLQCGLTINNSTPQNLFRCIFWAIRSSSILPNLKWECDEG